jgi:AcrR family transcriptional regulator
MQLRQGQQSEEHIAAVRQRILNSAKALCVQQGYKKTTIRQIAEHSGVLTGSIYNLFKNKEDIFQAMVLSLTYHCIEKINEFCVDETAAFKYAAVCEVELKAVENDAIVRETYFAGYNSPAIFESLVNQFTELAHHLLGSSCSFEDDEIYRISLLVKGAMRSCVAEFYFKSPGDPAQSRDALVRLALALFHISRTEIEAVMERIQSQEELWSEIGNQLRDWPL